MGKQKFRLTPSPLWAKVKPMPLAERHKIIILLCVFAGIYAAMASYSLRQISATFDEPVQLMVGAAITQQGDYRLDANHPPLARILSALPWQGEAQFTMTPACAKADHWRCAYAFLYQDNDADSLLFQSRLVNVALGLLLALIFFAFAYELFGFNIAALLLLFFGFEPNILAHARLATTDMAYVTFSLGTLYFLSRLLSTFRWLNVVGLCVFSALALAAKFSALILVPIIALGLLGRAFVKTAWGDIAAKAEIYKKIGLVVGLLLLVWWIFLWAAYGFHHAPKQGDAFALTTPALAKQIAPLSTQVVNTIDDWQLLPQAYVQGFLRTMVRSARGAPSYLLGEGQAHGWTFYYPLAFLFKTSASLLLLFALSLFWWPKDEDFRREYLIFLWGPALLIVLSAMNVQLNSGIRYLLLLYPLFLLGAGRVLALLLKRRLRWLIGTLLVLSALELATVYPYPLTFFNGLVGGPANGHRLLVDSNLDWGQQLIGLKTWMDKEGVEHINLRYTGTAEPNYYGIKHTDILGDMNETGGLPDPSTPIQLQLPGYVAVGATNLVMEKGVFAELYKLEPVAVLQNSLFIYYLEKPWWE